MGKPPSFVSPKFLFGVEDVGRRVPHWKWETHPSNKTTVWIQEGEGEGAVDVKLEMK